MKILFFVASLYGGGMERIATSLASHFVKSNQVIVAHFSNKNKKYPIDSKVKTINIEPKSPIKLFHPWERLSNIRETIKSVDPDILLGLAQC